MGLHLPNEKNTVDKVKGATCLVDINGKIKLLSDKILKIMPNLKVGDSIYNKIDIFDVEIIKKLIFDVNETGFTNSDIVLKKDTEEYYTISVRPFYYYKNLNYLIVLKPRFADTNVLNENKENMILASSNITIKVNEILELIKKQYPFNSIGKMKVQQALDSLDSYAWLKKVSGEIILVNNRYAEHLGINVYNLDNKTHNELLKETELSFIQSLDEHIKSTKRDVKVTLYEASGELSEIVEIPLTDIDNNIAVILGYKTLTNKELEITKNEDTIFNLDESKNPIMIIDAEGEVKVINKSFINYFGDLEEIRNQPKNIREIFGDEISKLIRNKTFNNKNSYTIQIPKDQKKVVELEIQSLSSISPKAIFENELNENFMTKTVDISMEENLIQLIPKPIYIYNTENLKFLDVNKHAEELYGYNRKEFLEIDLTDLYAPEDIQNLIESSNKHLLSSSTTGPWRHKKRDGSIVYVEIGTTKVDYQGRKAHLNIISDVSEQVNNNIEAQINKVVFENSDNAILRIDPEGIVLFANENFGHEFKVSPDEFINKSLLTIIDKNDRDRVVSIINKLKQGKSFVTKISLEFNDNFLGEREVKFIPIMNFNNNVDSHILIFKATKYINNETDQLESSDKKILNKTVTESKDSLSISFLSHLFHEILTPINVIVGFGQEITESIDQPTEEQLEWKEIIDENQKLLLQTMNIAAEYASIQVENIKLNLDIFNFVNLLDEIEDNIRNTSKTKGVDFIYGKISSSLQIQSDKRKFLTFISLLLTYAISISDKKEIFLSAYPISDEEFIISIKDSTSSTSQNLIDKLNSVFHDEESLIRQKFGFSRFSIRLANKLIELLSAKPLISDAIRNKTEFGFVFPMKLSSTHTELHVENEINKLSHEFDKTENNKLNNTLDKENVRPQFSKPKYDQAERESPIDEESTLSNESKFEEHNLVPSNHSSENYNMSDNLKSEKSLSTSFDYSNLTCLYIEDQVDSQLLLKAQMRDLKQIDFVTNFEDAIPLLNSKKYDFIITDINLQGEYNGLDALRIIQKTSGYQNVPVIAVTAYALPGDRDRFIEAGFFEFISKPLMKNKLLEILNRVFN